MQIFRQLDAIPEDFGPTVAIIGNFDGVHAGHQWVMRNAIACAKTIGAKTIAVTLEPHPARVLRPQFAPKLITPLDEKLSLLAQTGLDATLVLPFTTEVARWSAEEFASTCLAKKLHAVEVHEGENFRFGHHASADVADLAQMGEQLGFSVRVNTPQQVRGITVSSSRIRELLQQGNVDRVRPLLGRAFSIRSTPATGRGYGTRYAVPTINLAPYAELLPANGVYITCMTIGDGEQAEQFESVTNIGNRPTFGADSFAVESHLLNFHPIDLTEETPVTLTFLSRLREEKQWPSPEALKQQIALDVSRAQRYFRLYCRLRQPA
jgi:riboflavin kinase/FMN adenylyltransferase